jgi:hypothetical protein
VPRSARSTSRSCPAAQPIMRSPERARWCGFTDIDGRVIPSFEMP